MFNSFLNFYKIFSLMLHIFIIYVSLIINTCSRSILKWILLIDYGIHSIYPNPSFVSPNEYLIRIRLVMRIVLEFYIVHETIIYYMKRSRCSKHSYRLWRMLRMYIPLKSYVLERSILKLIGIEQYIIGSWHTQLSVSFLAFYNCLIVCKRIVLCY